MESLIRVMKALSDPNRVRVLKLLHGKELCVCEIQTLLGLAQSTVSKHMKILEDAGLVTRLREGSWIIYRLSNGEDSLYAQTMLRELKDWLKEDEALAAMVAALPEARVMRNSCKA